MLKQDMECPTKQSLIYACPEESTEQKRQTRCRVGNNTGAKCPWVPCTGDSGQLCSGKAPLGFYQPTEQPAGLLGHCPPGLSFVPKSNSLVRAFHSEKHKVLSRSVEKVKAEMSFLSSLFQPFIALKEGLHFTQVWSYKTLASLKSKVTPINIIQNNVQPL